LALGGLEFCVKRSRRHPNILFLFSDDQRFDTIRALGNPEIITPNLGRLVRRGVTFTRAHIMGGTSGAVCVPSRAMLLTGRTLFHLKSQGGLIPDEHIMIPEVLKQSGYTTFGTGKWHNGRKAYARCFTQGGKVMFGGMSNHLKVPVFDFDPSGQYPAEKQYTGEKFSSTLFSDEAVEFLEKDRKIPTLTTMFRFKRRVHKYHWFGLLTEEQTDRLTTGAKEINYLIWSEIKWKRPIET